MNTPVTSDCPSADRLAQLVSGSLIESDAEQLFEHLERCPDCQSRVDRLAGRGDHVIKAVRRLSTRPPGSEDANLSRLIRQAQRLDRPDDTRSNQRSTTQAVSAADFVDGLRRSGLLPGEELNQLLNEWSRDDTVDETDGSSLAKALIENRKLTPFQARLLLRGRWKGLVLGNYAILERLGQGGMGSVFKARHTRMGRIVCLKVVSSSGRQSPAVIERFRNEARALAALTHPNIVVAHDADESKGVPYLVMEYIDGDDLAKTVRAAAPLSVADTLDVAIQTAEALHYAHGQGVTHRDVKPHNLVATRDPDTSALTVKVLDLGLARFDTLITDNPDASVLAAMTNTGVVIGTVDYMSPEQALDSRQADARSDIYSLGCTLFFLLTGQTPFPGDTVMKRLIAHREQPVPRLNRADVSDDVEAVIRKMLAKRPADRYPTMQGALNDLRCLVAGRSPEAAHSVEATVASPLAAPTSPVQPVQPAVPSPQATVVPPGSDQPTVSMETDPATLDFEFDIPHVTANPSVSAKGPKTKRRRTKFLAANGATAFAFLVIAAAAVMAAPIWRWIGPRVGGDRAIRNGGDGRALVIVSSDHFREDEFRSLAGWLGSNDIDLVAASANYGTGKKDFGGELKSPYENVRLHHASATDFDAVFVIGGMGTELTHKEPKIQKEVIRIVQSALQNDVVLIGNCEGWHVIQQTKLIAKREYEHKPKFKVNGAHELAGKADYVFKHLLTQNQVTPSK